MGELENEKKMASLSTGPPEKGYSGEPLLSEQSAADRARTKDVPDFNGLTMPNLSERLVGDSLKAVVYDRRDYTPWYQRPLLQRIMDLPHELLRSVEPIPTNVHDLARRVEHMWQIPPEQIDRYVNPRLLKLLTDVYDLRSTNPEAYIGRLNYEYNQGCMESKSPIAMFVELEVKDRTVHFSFKPVGTVGLSQSDNMDLSESATKEFLLSVLSFTKTLKDMDPELQRLNIRLVKPSSGRSTPFYMQWLNNRLAHQFGIESAHLYRMSCVL